MSAFEAEGSRFESWRAQKLWRVKIEYLASNQEMGVRFPPRAPDRKIWYNKNKLHRSKPQKNPEKNIGSNHILIFGEENFLIIILNPKKKNFSVIANMFIF